MNKRITRYYSGRSSLLILIRFRLSMLKYLFLKKKYPLFAIQSSGKGLISSNKMLKKIKMCKSVRFNHHQYFSLTIPHWPSKAFDLMVAHGGLNITAAGSPLKRQIDTAILAITSRCNYKCSHCYEYFNLCDHDKIPIPDLKQVIRTLQEKGVSVVTLSGGEPMMRYDGLLEILRAGDPSRSDFHIHTSGFGVTREKAVELKNAGLHAAGIGLDDVNPDRNDAFRGFKGAYEQAVSAIRSFQDAGVFVYVNTCPTIELIRSGDLYRYFELMKDLNVGIVRWLEPKPCGAYLNEDAEGLLTDTDRAILTNLYINANTRAVYKNYPMISYEAFAEAPENMGCMLAGHSHFYIDSSGNVEPCVFLPVTFGNILQEDFSVIFGRMRMAIPAPLHTLCPSVQLCTHIQRKKESGTPLPVPYEELKAEFGSLRNSV